MSCIFMIASFLWLRCSAPRAVRQASRQGRRPSYYSHCTSSALQGQNTQGAAPGQVEIAACAWRESCNGDDSAFARHLGAATPLTLPSPPGGGGEGRVRGAAYLFGCCRNCEQPVAPASHPAHNHRPDEKWCGVRFQSCLVGLARLESYPTPLTTVPWQ